MFIITLTCTSFVPYNFHQLQLNKKLNKETASCFSQIMTISHPAEI